MNNLILQCRMNMKTIKEEIVLIVKMMVLIGSQVQ